MGAVAVPHLEEAYQVGDGVMLMLRPRLSAPAYGPA